MMTLKELRETFDDDKMVLVILYNEYLISKSEEIAKEMKIAYNESTITKDSSFLGGYESEIKRIIEKVEA